METLTETSIEATQTEGAQSLATYPTQFEGTMQTRNGIYVPESFDAATKLANTMYEMKVRGSYLYGDINPRSAIDSANANSGYVFPMGLKLIDSPIEEQYTYDTGQTTRLGLGGNLLFNPTNNGYRLKETLTENQWEELYKQVTYMNGLNTWEPIYKSSKGNQQYLENWEVMELNITSLDQVPKMFQVWSYGGMEVIQTPRFHTVGPKNLQSVNTAKSDTLVVLSDGGYDRSGYTYNSKGEKTYLEYQGKDITKIINFDVARIQIPNTHESSGYTYKVVPVVVIFNVVK